MGTGLVVALRPQFKRFNSFHRGGSQRLSRRPASLLAPPDIVPQCDQNGVAKCSSTEGPAAWATSFEKLLEDPAGLHTFAEFLKKEFSAENIYFWTACERYRKLSPGNERIVEAERIYQRHLSVGAPEAVNVDAHGRQCAEQCLQDPTCTLFDQAQKQIFNLMKFDSYPRFLKSDIYKQCLSGDIEKPALDAGLMIHTPTSTPSKLKKSLSNAEDRRRKSLLPWHRKNRSKSKDRGEIEYTQKRSDINASNENVDDQIGKTGRTDLHSSHSSLTSLDLAILNQDVTKARLTNLDELNMNGNRTPLCKVLLSNGSTTVVQIKESETIQQLVTRVLDKRGIAYSSFEVFTNKQPKPMDISEPSTKLAGCEVTVEQRVVFKLDLPNRKIISVKSKYTKIIVDVLRPILHKYQYNLEQVVVTNMNSAIDLHLPVTSIDGARLNVQLLEDVKHDKTGTVLRMNNIKSSKLDEITNKVFEGILQEKADAVSFKPTKSDKGSVKSEDWGSEHSSGIIGKFLRRDSGVHDRKKRLIGPKFKGTSHSGSTEDVENEQNQIKKPLIAKWKAGANKLHVTCSESDELVEGLTRAQRCRLEDQRGTEINFELPDFLKENEHNFHKPIRTNETETNSRFYLGETRLPLKVERNPTAASAKKLEQSNYENRNVLLANESSRINNKLICNQNQHSRMNSSRVMSPCNLSSEESSKSNQSTPSKCSSLENTVIENTNANKNNDPPPLPPKPKIVPIKPPNWGQLNGFHKSKNISVPNDRNQGMFLEQPSSSFV
ncbi:regulator of G-protein signaling loco isoform X4 [Anoplophora glabripennis]|nr:regulator of G-protein signaling loco isoform X4 [Anoplophora glabripennis]